MRPFFEETILHDATEAIERVISLGGGSVRVAVRLGTSPQTVNNIRRAGRVQNAVFAHLMADIARESGDETITSRVLSGMDEWKRRGRKENGTHRAHARGGRRKTRDYPATGAQPSPTAATAARHEEPFRNAA